MSELNGQRATRGGAGGGRRGLGDQNLLFDLLSLKASAGVGGWSWRKGTLIFTSQGPPFIERGHKIQVQPCSAMFLHVNFSGSRTLSEPHFPIPLRKVSLDPFHRVTAVIKLRLRELG